MSLTPTTRRARSAAKTLVKPPMPEERSAGGVRNLPTFDRLMKPLLQALQALGGSGSIEEIYDKVVELEHFTDDVLSQLHDSEKSNQTEVAYRLAWARTYLKKYGFLANSKRTWIVLRRLLGVFTALAFLFQFPLAASPAAAQAGGALVQYEGTLTLSDAPAAAGTVIHAVAAQTWSDMTDCGQAQAGAQGHYTLQITSRDCITPDMNHRPIDHYFVVNGENVGRAEPSAWLNLPNTLGHTLQASLRGTAVPSMQESSPSKMVLVRYIGTLRLAGAAAGRGTPVVVSTAPTGSDAVACGSGQVVDDQGLYVVDVQNPQCITPDMNHRPIDHYFAVNGENVGHTEPSVWLNLAYTLGKVFSQDLRGIGLSGPGDVFSIGPTTQPPAAQTQSQPGPQSEQQPGGQDLPPGQPTGQPATPQEVPPAPPADQPARAQELPPGQPSGEVPPEPQPVQPVETPAAPPVSAQIWSVEFAADAVVQDCDTAHPVDTALCPVRDPSLPPGDQNRTLGERTVGEFQGVGCDGPLSTADWIDCGAEPDGIPEKDWPVIVVAGEQLTIKEARFRIPDGQQLTGASISAEATAVPEGTSEPITLTFRTHDAQIMGNELVVQNMTSDEALPTVITALAPLTIAWAVKIQGQASLSLASTSPTSHLIFVMRAHAVNPAGITHINAAPPDPSKPYVSLVSLTVKAALGVQADDDQGVFDAIWSAFTDPSRATITRYDLNPVNAQVTPGELLHYWNPWSLSDILQGADFTATQLRNCPVFSVPDMLSTTVGKCRAWANFFANALGVQGLRSTFIDEVFYLDDPAVGNWLALGFPADATFMLVGRQAWHFSTPNSTTSGYPNLVTARANPFAYQQEGVSYAPDGTPLGQGNTSPPGLFTTGDHALVLYGNQLFDPSYGQGPFDTIGQWAAQSLAGYATFSPGSAQGKGALACPLTDGICTFYAHEGVASDNSAPPAP